MSTDHLGVLHRPLLMPIQTVDAMGPMGHAGMRKPSLNVVRIKGIELHKSNCQGKEWTRVVAGNCFIKAGFDGAGGVKLLNQLLPDHGIISSGTLRRFVEDWGKNLLKGQGPYHDANRSGRPTKVDPATASWLAKTIAAGYAG